MSEWMNANLGHGYKGESRADQRRRRQIADVAVHDAKQRGDCGLVRRDAVEVAQRRLDLRR
jgi:hypothetical protein